MDASTPGQFDFGQQNRTFRLDLLRSVPEGLLATAFTTFVVYVAIRFLDLPPWMKGLMLGAGSVGQLLSLFVVQIVRRIGWPVNWAAGLLWLVASAGFAVAAYADGRPWIYFFGVCLAAIAFGAGSPLLLQIYRKHYDGEHRGRLFSWSTLSRTFVAAAAGWGFGVWAEMGSIKLLFLVYAVSCVAMTLCVMAMAPVRLRASNRIQWFDAFQHAAADKPFRKLLVVWMVFGFGNLISLALFVEFIGNPRYGFALAADQSGLITSTIPMLVIMLTVVPWGWVFDRLPFYQMRAVVNLIFVVGILIYFLGDSMTTLMIGIAVHGIARSGGELLWSLWTTRFADSERVIEYQSVHTFLTGVRGVLAPLVAFAVIGWFGPVSVAWISAALMMGSTLIILPEVCAECRAARKGVIGRAWKSICLWRRRSSRMRSGDFIVNEERKVVYQALPKVACTTWKNIMARLAGIEVEAGCQLHRGGSGLVQVSRPSADQLHDWNQNYFVFTFIRNPWARVLSAYIDKMERKMDRNPKVNRWAKYARRHHIVSFETFVRHLEKCEPAEMNSHWAPQCSLLMLERIHYDFIGRFEEMQSAAEVVLNRLGLKGTLDEYTQNHHRSGADRHIVEYYTPELVELIGRIYADDVKLGGYTPPVL